MLSEINALRKTNSELKAKLSSINASPAVSDLAGLDENFKVRIQVENHFSKVNTSVTVTWRAIFVAAASSIRMRSTRYNLSTAIGLRLAQNNNGSKFTGAQIDDDDLETILVQLTALGLLGTQDRTYYSLTHEGSRRYIIEAVVKSEKA